MFIVRLVLIALTILSVVYVGYQKIENEVKITLKRLFPTLLCIIALIGTMCVSIIPSNTVGIKYSVFDGTSETTLPEGIVIKSPFDKVYLIDTTIQERTVESVSVQTKDAQFLNMQINVKYRVNSNNAFKVYKGYRTLENLNNNIIANYAQKSIEKIVTQYNIIEVLGEKKSEIYQLSTIELEKMLSAEGVELKELIIKDMDAGAEIEQAIRNEAIAKKSVETAEQERLKAEKDAETKIIIAQGQADANAIMTEALTEEVLKNKAIEKWDGKLPIVSGDNGNMIDISSIMGKSKE